MIIFNYISRSACITLFTAYKYYLVIPTSSQVPDEMICTNIIFNCISLGKVNSVPHKTTAFRHADTTNLLVGGWSNEVPTMHNGDLITSDPTAVVGGQDAFIALWGRARIMFAENYIPLQKIKRKYDPEVILTYYAHMDLKWLCDCC